MDLANFDVTKLGSDQNVADYVGLLADGMNVIAKVTGNATVDRAADVLTVIKMVVEAVTNAFAGKVTPEAVRAEFKLVATNLDANDGRADAALKAKFPPT